MRDTAHRGTHHCSDKQAWAENSSGVAGGITHGGSDDFQNTEQNYGLDNNVTVENLLHKIIANAQHIRREITHDTDGEPACHWLEPDSIARQLREPLAQTQQEFHKNRGSQ